MAGTGLGQAALGGAKATALWQAIRIGLLVLSIIILARLVGPADYGLVAMVLAVIGLGELLRDMGLSMASVQAKTLASSEKSNLFWINTAIGGLLTAAVFAAAQPIGLLYGREELVGITQLLSLTFLLNGIATQFKAQINRDLRFMALGVSEAVPQLAGLSFAIWWALEFGGYGALVLQALVVSAGGLVLTVALARWRPGWYSKETSIRRFLGFGGALAGTQVLAYASKNLDTVLIGLTASTAQVGWYNRAYQVVSLPLTQLTGPMSRVAIPILSRVQQDAPRFRKYLRAGQFFSVGLASALFGIAFGLADPLVASVLGERWLPAAPLIQALALSGIFRAMGQVPYWLFVSRGLAGKQFRFYLVAQPLIVIGILAGVPFGPLGIAIGVSSGYAAFWVAQMLWASRATGVPTLGLAGSALFIVAVLAVPVGVVGLAAQAFIADDIAAIIVGACASVVYVVSVLFAVPSFRRHLLEARRIARKR